MRVVNGRLVCLILVFLVYTSPLTAEVVARQGEKTEEIEEFTSPMVLEVPFAKAIRFPEGTGQRLEDLRKFVCEDTFISLITAKKVRASDKRGDRFSVDGSIFVRRSHDRWVTLILELMLDSEPLAFATKAKIDAEENNTRKFSLLLSLSPEATAKATEHPDSVVLKITVKVEDND